MLVRQGAKRRGASAPARKRSWRSIRRGAAWLLLGSCGAALTQSSLVATPVVSFPTYTSPTEMDGTNPQVITLTMSTTGTDSFSTLAFDAVLNWTVTGTTWSGNPITPDLVTLSNFDFTAVGDLYQPLNSPSALSGNVTDNSSPSVGQAQFFILSNGDINVGVPYQTSPIGTVDFTVDADVRAATFTLAFSSNPNFSFFTEATTVNGIPFSDGGGSVTVVPEPMGLGSAAGLAALSTLLGTSAWRLKRRRAAGKPRG